MGVGISLLSDIENAGLVAFAGVNIIILVHLFAKGTDTYVAHLDTEANEDDKKHSKSYTDARLRLDAFWTVMTVIATAAALKLTLPAELANQIIAAWFVGQGFALQPYVQSYISGIKARSNLSVWNSMYCGGDIDYKDEKYKLSGQTVFSLTLCTTAKNGATAFRLLPWTAIDDMTVHAPC